MVEGQEPAKKMNDFRGRGKIVGMHATKKENKVEIALYCLIENNPDQSQHQRYLFKVLLENFVEASSTKDKALKNVLGDIGYEQLLKQMQMQRRDTLYPDVETDIHSIPNWSASFFHQVTFFVFN